MPQVDYIIVGQGLAGSCLSIELLRRKKKIIVIDEGYVHSASRIAAGVFNPITGRTNQPTWKASEIFPSLISFYRETENLFSEKFLYELPIYRPFLNQQEYNRWPEESNQWIKEIRISSQFPDQVNDPFGGIEIKLSGYLDTISFLSAAKKFLIDNNCLLDQRFNFNHLKTSETVKYEEWTADKIIFCDGVEANTNSFFSWLPIRKLKGELLLVQADLPNQFIINRGIFSVPTNHKNEFIVGSTYYHDADAGINEQRVLDILKRCKELFKTEITIKQKYWGHRPTTVDRRPILGSHPFNKKVYTFNGLGTKGVSLAPFFALHLADWLDGKIELNKEVNIERFYSLHLKS